MADSRFNANLLISSVEANGYSRSDLAREARVHPSTITRLAMREIKNPSYSLVMKLEKAAERFARTQKR